MSKLTQKIKVKGMHCSSCALNIDFDLEDLNGVIKAQTSFTKEELEVEFDDEIITLAKIQEQISKSLG